MTSPEPHDVSASSVLNDQSPDALALRQAAVPLLTDLQSNLWASLRHTLDVDKVTLTALWLSNLGGMVLTILAQHQTIPRLVTVASLGIVDFFIFRTFQNSLTEARRLINLLTEIYTDHGLGAYFDQLREDYFIERYRIRLILCPVLFGIAVALGLAFGLAA